MKTFDEIYEELQSADNSELENTWKEAKKENQEARKKAIVICLIIDIIVVTLLFKLIFSSIYGIAFTLMFGLVFNIIIFATITAFSSASKKNIEFITKYKNIVINKLINNFYDNLEYFPHKQMPEYIYEQLKYEEYNKYDSDDYFEALINNKYSIQMAEVLTKEERTYKDKDGETKKEVITKFHGLFAKIEMDKSINSKLRIGQNGSIFSRKALKMDSSEFEKYFDVEASDKIIGMQLLTADVMEELIDFINKTKMKYDIFIENSELYLRFHSGTMFEFLDFKKELLDRELIQKYFYMLNFTYNLSNKLITVINDTSI